MNQTIVAINSQNKKLTNGAIGVAATYRPVGVGGTCPKSCKLLNNGCYAQKGHTRYASVKAKRIHADLQKVADARMPLLRLNVSGDFFKGDRLDKGYIGAVKKFAKENPRIKIWGYTHCWKSFDKNKIEHKSINNLTILASCDSVEDTIKARKAGWLTARVVDTFESTQLMPGEAKCLNQTVGISCAECGICFRKHPNFRGVVFQKH